MHSAEKRLERVGWALVAPAALGLAIVCWGTFRLLPYWPWSASRLASMLRLPYGLPLYPPAESASMHEWIYGPLAPLGYWPAAWADEPLNALRIAAALNTTYFLLPAVALFLPLVQNIETRWMGVWGFLFAVSAALLPFGIWYGAAVLHVDTLTICLGMFSCIALVRSERVWPAALLCALAIWTKQTAAPLALAHIIFLARVRGRQRTFAYAAWLILALAATTALFSGWFGGRNLWHHLIEVPSSYPFELERLAGELSFAAWPVWWIVPVLVVAWKWGPRPEGGAIDREVQLGWLLVLVATVSLPTGIAAVVKYGGSQNSLHSLAYAIFGGALLLCTLVRTDRLLPARAARVTLLAGTFAIVAVKLQRVIKYDYLGTTWTGLRHREAFNFAKAHPGEAFFPWNTLVTLMAERKDYPSEGGYRDRLKAKNAPPPADLRRQFPATIRFVIYHEDEQPTGEALAIFPDFSAKRVAGPWTFHTRPSEAAAGTGEH